MGHQRQCWQSGGRKNCTANDPVFEIMEADLHNLVPAVGEVNGDRSNYSMAEIPDAAPQYGACDAETDFKGRKFEPRDEVKGQVARIYFYMADRYNLRLSKKDQRLFMAWDRMYPVTAWERERDRRVARRMGHSNPFVTGERRWSIGYKPSGDGLGNFTVANVSNAGHDYGKEGSVRGNRNSKVYHLPEGCPSYDRVSHKNRVTFSSEADAISAGFRKAGNCR
ncbi:deoxyribonuclease-1 [Litorivivens lipolytica]|uniref:Deoxyribonuclease-1 n=2 Tax=Litorivivens lipolytica TaxID=1524264 RepID=A0A7W4Z6X5_9GAMM|nr:deoxyribonuclease-1 [Litorivivens lipolytica]